MAHPVAPHSPQIHHIVEKLLDGVALLILGGEFDAFSAPEVEKRLTEMIDRGAYEIVVDMTAVTFVDLSTLNGLVRAIKRVYQHNGHLVVVTVSRPVLRAIELAGMRHSIRVVATQADALAVLRDAAA